LSDSLTELIEAAKKERTQKRYREAADLVERALAQEPTNALALNEAAEISLEQNQLEQAENFASAACSNEPRTPYILTLANICKNRHRFDEGLKHYTAILKREPLSFGALAGMADLYERAGYRSRAIEHYNLLFSRHPMGDYAAFMQYTKLFSYDRSSEVLATLSRMLPNSPDAPFHLAFHMEYVSWRENAARAARGLPPTVASPDELFFTFAAAERDNVEALVDAALASQPLAVFHHHAKALCLVARGERKQAEALFRRVAEVSPNMASGNVVFADAFYFGLEALDESAILSRFPLIVDVRTAPFTDRPVALLSSDYSYFLDFGRPFLLSINALSPGAQVHVHVMNPPENGTEAISKFCDGLTSISVAISTEQTPMPTRQYYHSARFVRQWQLLRRYRAPVWLVDVDSLLNRDWTETLESLGGADVGVTGYAGIWAPWNQFRAGIVGIGPTPRGMNYAKLLAAYVSEFYVQNKLRWGIDQVALYGVYAFLKDQNRAPLLKLLDTSLIDGDYKDETIIWCNGGFQKFSTLTGLKDEPGIPDSPKVKYTAALQKYGL